MQILKSGKRLVARFNMKRQLWKCEVCHTSKGVTTIPATRQHTAQFHHLPTTPKKRR